MMQWQRLTPRSFADALAALSERRWWSGSFRRNGAKVEAAAAPTARATDKQPSRLVRLRRPF